MDFFDDDDFQSDNGANGSPHNGKHKDDFEPDIIYINPDNNPKSKLSDEMVAFKRKITVTTIIVAVILLIALSLIFTLVLTSALREADTKGKQLLSSIEREYYLPEGYDALSNAVYQQNKNGVLEINCTETRYGTKYTGSATAVVLNENGYLLTNAHVIYYEYTQTSGFSIRTYTDTYDDITVNYADSDTTYTARIVHYDSELDLAILKMTSVPNDLTPIRFGNSDYLNYGEDAITIGNGEGFGLSVTSGIISKPLVTIKEANGSFDYIMTNAAVNPGSSGGPLLNVYAEMMGVISSKIASEENEGLGFAIPSLTAIDYIDTVIASTRTNIDYYISYRGSIVTRFPTDD